MATAAHGAAMQGRLPLTCRLPDHELQSLWPGQVGVTRPPAGFGDTREQVRNKRFRA